MKAMKKLLNYPLLIFMLLGGLLFWVYDGISGYFAEKKREILVSEAQVALLTETFTKRWFRPPNESELDAQINNFIMDEVLYREAVSMGLDKKDQAVKRRMRQMMDMMLDDFSAVYPSEAQLRKFMEDHPEKFRRESTISLKQLYFEFKDEESALALLSKYQAGGQPKATDGSRLSLLPQVIEGETESGIERLFGKNFKAAVFDIDIGVWQGPIASGYGLHLVKVNERQEGQFPQLSEVWDIVEREWSAAQRIEMKEKLYDELKSRYQITVELPPASVELGRNME